jgi:hypothetical protein
MAVTPNSYGAEALPLPMHSTSGAWNSGSYRRYLDGCLAQFRVCRFPVGSRRLHRARLRSALCACDQFCSEHRALAAVQPDLGDSWHGPHVGRRLSRLMRLNPVASRRFESCIHLGLDGCPCRKPMRLGDQFTVCSEWHGNCQQDSSPLIAAIRPQIGAGPLHPGQPP